MVPVELNQIIDLERYPIDQPGHGSYRELIAAGREALNRQALFAIKQFVRPRAVQQMACELDSLVPASCRYQRMRNAYSYSSEQDEHDRQHPRRQLYLCRYNQVLNFQIANDSILRRVYYWQALTDFLRELCGYHSFYRSDCPHLALSSKIAGEGDTDGWHYDSNDVVFSILLQAPEAGGLFEYAPYIRSADDENYNGVAAVIADPQQRASRPDMEVGDLTVFKGDLSLHRVTPVAGARRRIVALFCYDQQPGTSFDQAYINELEQGLPSQACRLK